MRGSSVQVAPALEDIRTARPVAIPILLIKGPLFLLGQRADLFAEPAERSGEKKVGRRAGEMNQKREKLN